MLSNGLYGLSRDWRGQYGFRKIKTEKKLMMLLIDLNRMHAVQQHWATLPVRSVQVFFHLLLGFSISMAGSAVFKKAPYSD